jgi:hypothetical protein
MTTQDKLIKICDELVQFLSDSIINKLSIATLIGDEQIVLKKQEIMDKEKGSLSVGKFKINYTCYHASHVEVSLSDAKNEIIYQKTKTKDEVFIAMP